MDEPVVDLWFSVLSRAVADYLQRNLYAKHPRDRLQIERSASVWIHSNRNDVGSFTWVCHILNLEPTFVRSTIERARSRQAGRLYRSQLRPKTLHVTAG
jgi:hypothetical protein